MPSIIKKMYDILTGKMSPLKILLAIILLFVWLLVSAGLGITLLSAKQSLGINIFSNTGYHAFTACVQAEYKRAIEAEE